MTNLLSIIQSVSVLNRDNSICFTNTERLDAVAALLCDSVYKRIVFDRLFHIYGRKPVEEQAGPVVIVSSHVDCERNITKYFAKKIDDGTLLGAFDNSITNAAIVYLMLTEKLPDNVLVAFAGDEEENG